MFLSFSAERASALRITGASELPRQRQLLYASHDPIVSCPRENGNRSGWSIRLGLRSDVAWKWPGALPRTPRCRALDTDGSGGTRRTAVPPPLVARGALRSLVSVALPSPPARRRMASVPFGQEASTSRRAVLHPREQFLRHACAAAPLDRRSGSRPASGTVGPSAAARCCRSFRTRTWRPQPVRSRR
jgi:hypothetical protein